MNEMFMLFPGFKYKALTLSYDDGVTTDQRLIGLMQKSGLKGTFNLNSGVFPPEDFEYPKEAKVFRLTQSQAVNLYTDSGMEVAVHSLTHPFLERLDPGEQCYEVITDRKNLEELFHTVVRGMAYPNGTYDATVLESLRQCGIVYARTIKSTYDFSLPTNWLELPATCHHNDEKLWELTERFLTEKPEKDPWLFYLWGHSYEFDLDHNWERIEEFAAKTGNREDVWYATNMEVYTYVEAFRSLVFSADGAYLQNPSAQTLYYRYQNKGHWETGSILPGETCKMICH